MDSTDGRPALTLCDEPHLIVLANFDKIAEVRLLQRLTLRECSFAKQFVRGTYRASAVDYSGEHAGGAEPRPDDPLHLPHSDRKCIGSRRVGESPQQQIAPSADALNFDRTDSSARFDAGDAAGAVAP